MGSYISRNALINKYIFRPPKTNTDYYHAKLTTDRSCLFDVNTQSGDKISAILVLPKNVDPKNVDPKIVEPKKYLVFAHANSDDIFSLIEMFMHWADHLNVNVVGFDYIGYGLSNSNYPNEKRSYQSLKAVIEYMENILGINQNQIYLIGQSLGTGIVIDFVSKHRWNNPIILISPYKTICRIIVDNVCVTPFDKFRSQDKLKTVTCPVKIIHGDQDKMIDISHAKKLYRKLINISLKPTWLEGIGHNNIMNIINLDIYQEVLDYAEKLIY